MRLSLLTSLTAGMRRLFAAPASSPKAVDHRSTLAAYLDTLLPAHHGPSATQLGVELKVMDKAHRSAGYRRLLEGGVDWLDTQARLFGAAGFAFLTDVQKEQVVARGAGAPARSLERRFFERTRADAFTFFYTDRRSWPPLGYDGPPQPIGFMDHASPPERRETTR